ncbi:MAG TPA: helix-turn-helix transcriptional regulator [Vicingus sp.]|nr:helix-turn-helix transcriptional regulator [Flavobacteriales bacterium]MCL4857290.1 helix-turn-helix domain-containing protein [Flavobacteriales bacterium]HRN42306.1 helix-turn-helix transcriptional regulator [Vicingus sp.]HRP60634.1 helix-turn-helix transcriptional regulator [Vicingus sp.]
MKKNIGTKVRQLRELKGFTQEYIASQLGVSQRAYSKIETNETRLDWEKLNKIADILEMNPTDIATFDDNLIFNNCHQSGKFEQFINQIPEKLIEQYEKRITHLENEIAFLREELKKR